MIKLLHIFIVVKFFLEYEEDSENVIPTIHKFYAQFRIPRTGIEKA